MDFAGRGVRCPGADRRAAATNLPRPHVGADPVNAGKITFEFESRFVPGVPAHWTFFRLAGFFVCRKNLELRDLTQPTASPHAQAGVSPSISTGAWFRRGSDRNRHGRARRG